MKKDEKRKTESKETEKKEKKKKTPKTGYKPPFQGYGWNNPGMGLQPGYQQPYPYAFQQGQGYPRPEMRACTNCGQQGHLMRNCPRRPPPSAAVGIAPK